MSRAPRDPVTELLVALRHGDEAAGSRLISLVDGELRRIARGRMRRLRDRFAVHGLSPSMETTGLVHEAYLRLMRDPHDWRNRAHFFAFAARRMRNICVDYARRALAAKRGAGRVVPLNGAEGGGEPVAPQPVPLFDLVNLGVSLDRLEALDRRKAQVVELKFFGGFTDVECAEYLEVSEATVKREWRMARAWLYQELRGQPGAARAAGRTG